MNRDFLKTTAGYVHRERLDRLIENGLNYPLISVVAGPGYGKTVAVTGYAKKTPLRLVWLRLQEADNDAYRLWADFMEAVSRELPGLAKALKNTSLSTVLGVYEVINQMFQRELEEGPPILLVFDNFECVTSPYMTQFLQLLVRAELPGLHVIVITNEKQPIGGIVPSSGQLRISMEDLSFTDEEMAALFAGYGLSFTQEQLQEIAASTARWPLALHLICVNQSNDNVDVLREMTHQQLAAELFEKHHFGAYSKDLQGLMVKLSCFERFPVELVERLAPDDSLHVIHVISQNVFISYDYRLRLFRFQNMYRSFLSQRQVLIPEEQKHAMYSYMGEWFLEHGFYYEALDCFWAIRDYDRYLKTVNCLPKARYRGRISSEILQYLDRFPKGYARKNPSLDFWKAVLILNSMQTTRAEAMLNDLLARLLAVKRKTKHIRTMLGDVYVVLFDISIYLNRDDGLAYIEKAAGLLTQGSRIRSRELTIVGNNNVFFLPDDGPGQLAHMERYIFRVAEYLDRVSNGSGAGYEWLFAAEATFLSERFEKSRENCHQAIAKARLTEQHDIICNAYWYLVRTELYVGDYQKAKQWLDELVAYVDTRRLAGLYELRDCAVSWFYIRLGDLEKVVPWVRNVAPVRKDDALDIGRNRIVIIYYLSVLGRSSEAYAEMTRLEEIMLQAGRWHEKNLLLMHKAIRLLEGNEKKAAVAVFREAYDMVYANDIAAIFAEFGLKTQKLIRAARAQAEIAFDQDWLEMVYRKAGSFHKREIAMQKAYRAKHLARKGDDFGLSPIELLILTHVVQGMTRKEIAQLQHTSLSNVKRYLTNIYAKLGAQNRADAINIANMHGIVKKME